MRNLISKIDISGLFKNLDLVLRRDLVEQLLQFFVLQHLVLDPLHFTLQPNDRLGAGRKMQVRSPKLVHHLKKSINLSQLHIPLHLPRILWES